MGGLWISCATKRRDGHAVADQGEHLGVAWVCVIWEVPGVALSSGEVIGRALKLLGAISASTCVAV